MEPRGIIGRDISFGENLTPLYKYTYVYGIYLDFDKYYLFKIYKYIYKYCI